MLSVKYGVRSRVRVRVRARVRLLKVVSFCKRLIHISVINLAGVPVLVKVGVIKAHNPNLLTLPPNPNPNPHPNANPNPTVQDAATLSVTQAMMP